MTPAQQEAKRLILSFYEIAENKYPPNKAMVFAKQASLLCVDEMIKVCPYNDYEKRWDSIEQIREPEMYFMSYWQQVKTEIENYKQ